MLPGHDVAVEPILFESTSFEKRGALYSPNAIGARAGAGERLVHCPLGGRIKETKFVSGLDVPGSPAFLLDGIDNKRRLAAVVKLSQSLTKDMTISGRLKSLVGLLDLDRMGKVENDGILWDKRNRLQHEAVLAICFFERKCIGLACAGELQLEQKIIGLSSADVFVILPQNRGFRMTQFNVAGRGLDIPRFFHALTLRHVKMDRVEALELFDCVAARD